MKLIIIALVRRLAAWIVGVPFFNAVYEMVSYFDGMVDLDGDGKKERVIDELAGAGWLFGQRQVNRAIEWALVILEQEQADKRPTPTRNP